MVQRYMQWYSTMVQWYSTWHVVAYAFTVVQWYVHTIKSTLHEQDVHIVIVTVLIIPTCRLPFGLVSKLKLLPAPV